MEGPAIFRTNGELVWTESGWGRTSDLKVQQVGSRSYITFWHDGDSYQNDGGSYIVLDQSYQMVKELRPVGRPTSRPVELKLTQTGTAVMLMHHVTQASGSVGGLKNGWINEAIIQEIDVASNELLFEWRASEHFDVGKSRASMAGEQGSTPSTAFDFFHATGIDVDHNRNYIIASRNMCNAAAVRRSDGSVLTGCLHGGDPRDPSGTATRR
ncbi:hypothetical protein NQ176_g10021 [Zarea fungicola]|uniref:Uncharacterized protein n=1 Tax=Zarea fungicola TaxID=93591 RepID=A0ACC1MI74_9HYPO|nr:hypothetical protein NQ176_g10021 [Lecanicillium fungicola]